MADNQDLAALRTQVAALEARLQQTQPPQSPGAPAPGAVPYVMHGHIHPACFELCYMPSPPPVEDDDAPIRQQLGRIEEQLERVIALLEKRGA
jgi:hypothetical protein